MLSSIAIHSNVVGIRRLTGKRPERERGRQSLRVGSTEPRCRERERARLQNAMREIETAMEEDTGYGPGSRVLSLGCRV